MSMDETDEHTTDVTREWCEANVHRFEDASTWRAIFRCGSVNRKGPPPDGVTREQCIALVSYMLKLCDGAIPPWESGELGEDGIGVC